MMAMLCSVLCQKAVVLDEMWTDCSLSEAYCIIHLLYKINHHAQWQITSA
jgi:hypothetical protein